MQGHDVQQDEGDRDVPGGVQHDIAFGCVAVAQRIEAVEPEREAVIAVVSLRDAEQAEAAHVRLRQIGEAPGVEFAAILAMRHAIIRALSALQIDDDHAFHVRWLAEIHHGERSRPLFGMRCKICGQRGSRFAHRLFADAASIEEEARGSDCEQ